MTGGFFAVFDDIATLLDDAASMTKVATQKTVGILGDDLAVNAQKASNFAASRELPVLWAITKGSLVNKLIIVPLALLLSAFASWAIVPILLFGGGYLAYEGMEKIVEWIAPHKHNQKRTTLTETKSEQEILAIEKQKIKSAIRTDFILSIEIVIMALGIVMEHPLGVQIVVVSIVAFLATIGVYGIVALIVRMDDFGFRLITFAKEERPFLKKMGIFLVRALPKTIKLLTILGTIAMLLVGGGIYVHNITSLHHLLESWPSLVEELLVGTLLGLTAFVSMQVFLQLKKAIITPKK